MRLGVLYSGGKDSNLSLWIAKKQGHEISCLITLDSMNKESYMFHTPSISMTKKQSEAMRIPLVTFKTKGEKEKELYELEKAIEKAIENYLIEGIVTGAVESVYQSSRIQKICDGLKIKCFNPLWNTNQEEILRTLIKEGFKAIVVGVFAYPLGKGCLGRVIDDNFVKDIKKLNEKYKISISGEGGEYETFVLNGPTFKNELVVESYEDFGSENSWFREIVIG